MTDALTSRRPYKEPLPLEYALRVLAEGKGTHFDPVLVDAFTQIAPTIDTAVIRAEDAMVEQTLSRLTETYFYGDDGAGQQATA